MINNFTKRFVMVAMALVMTFSFFATVETSAQPTNYCNPCQLTGGTWYQYNVGSGWCYCYPDYSTYYPYMWIKNVRLTDLTTSTQIMTNPTTYENPNSCSIFQNFKPEFVLGQSYRMDITTSNYYYYEVCYNYNYAYGKYLRVYFDYNQDGDYLDGGETLVNWIYTYGPDYNFTFTVPNTASVGLTRMRVVVSMYYGMQDPCYIYAYWYGTYGYNYSVYGESEDYVVNIISGVKDTYPGQDSILFADESYNGTPRQKKWYNLCFC